MTYITPQNALPSLAPDYSLLIAYRFPSPDSIACFELVLICLYYQNFGTNMKHRIINTIKKILLPQIAITIHILMITLISYFFQEYYQFSNIRGF